MTTYSRNMTGFSGQTVSNLPERIVNNNDGSYSPQTAPAPFTQVVSLAQATVNTGAQIRAVHCVLAGTYQLKLTADSGYTGFPMLAGVSYNLAVIAHNEALPATKFVLLG